MSRDDDEDALTPLEIMEIDVAVASIRKMSREEIRQALLKHFTPAELEQMEAMAEQVKSGRKPH